MQVELQGGMLASLLAEETERLTLAYVPVIKVSLFYRSLSPATGLFWLTLAYVPVIKSLTQEVEDLKAELRAGKSGASAERICR